MRRRAAQGLAVAVLMLSPLNACNSKHEEPSATAPAARAEPERSPPSGFARASRSALDSETAARRSTGSGKRQSAPGEPGTGPEDSRIGSEAPKDRPVRQARLSPHDLEALGGFGAEPAPSTRRATADPDLLEEFPDDSPRASIGEAEPAEAESDPPVHVFRGDVDYMLQLESFDPVLRAEAAEMIEPEGLGLRALLVVAAEDPDPLVRVSAVAQLGEADSRAALRGLVRALEDGDRRVVLEAIDAIEFVAGPRGIPRLVPLLDHADGEVREAAAEAIDFLE